MSSIETHLSVAFRLALEMSTWTSEEQTTRPTWRRLRLSPVAEWRHAVHHGHDAETNLRSSPASRS